MPAQKNPLKEAVLGAAIGFAIFGLLLVALEGCGASTQTLRCELDSMKVLPRDPEQITIGDLRDVAGRIRACRSAELAPLPPELEER